MRLKFVTVGWLLLNVVPLLAQDLLTRHFLTDGAFRGTSVYRILPDTNGTAWFGTDNGLVYFNGTTYEAYTFQDSVYNNGVLAICPDSTGSLWLSLYQDGLYRFSDGKLTQFARNSHGSKSLINLKFDGRGELWGISAGSELIQYHPDTLISYFPEGSTEVRQMRYVNDTLWLCTSRGILFRGPEDTTFHTYPATGNLHVIEAVRDQNEGWWILTTSQLFRLSQGQLEAHPLPNPEVIPNFLEQDHTGALWLGFYNKGIYRWFPNEDMWWRIHSVPIGSLVNAIQVDELGQVWIAVEGQGAKVCFSLDGVSVFPIPDVRSLAVDDQDQVWVGTFGSLFHFRQDQVLQRDSLPFMNPDEEIKWMGPGPVGWVVGGARKCWQLRSNNQWQLLTGGGELLALEQDDKTWWAGRYNGLFSFDSILSNTSPYVGERLSKTRINALAHGPEGALWAASVGTLIRMTEQDTTYWDESDGVPNASLTDLLWKNDTLWIASQAGLLAWHNNVVYRHTHQACHQLAEDYHGRLWFTTEYGVYYQQGDRIRPFSWDAHAFTQRPYALVASPDSILWVGYPEALVRIDLPKQDLSGNPPPLLFEVYNTCAKLNSGDRIDFEDYAYSLYLTARPQGWDHAGIWSTEYRVLPHDTQWHEVQQGWVQLANLRPGSFSIEARLRHVQNGRAYPAKPITLTLTPPFYRAFWFRSLVGLTLLASLLLLYRFWIQRVHRKAVRKLENEREMHRLHHLALTHCLHPHYLTNMLQTLQHVLRKQSTDHGALYVKRLASWIRLNLEDAQQPFISLEKELDRLDLYLQLEQSRLGDRLQYSIQVAPELDVSEHLIPGMLIQPIVENAVVHGILQRSSEGSIAIFVHEENDTQVRIVVEDNGPGWQEQQDRASRTSFGMRLVREKLSWTGLPHSLQVESTKADTHNSSSGTRIILVVPSLAPGQTDYPAVSSSWDTVA